MSLGKIRKSTRNEVEGALAGLKTRRADLQAKLTEVESEISLAEKWLGRGEDLLATKQLTLQNAMAVVLREAGEQGLKPQRLADVINERGLYRKKDGGPVGANQIQARVTNYSHMFERVNGLIRLKQA